MPKLPLISIAEMTSGIARLDVLLERAANAEMEGRRDDAIQLYRRVLNIDPTLLHAINRLGVVSGQNGDLQTAARQFVDSLRIDPRQPDAWYNLGIAQSMRGLPEQALASFDRMMSLAPPTGLGQLERGTALARLGRHREALTAFSDAVRLLPDHPGAAGHRGWTLQWCGEIDEASREYDRAIALKPEFAEAWTSKAMLMLLLGDLAGGFALYEWRWRLAGQPPEMREAAHAFWLGQAGIAGKTLLISAEQGNGDVIQFCRFATLAANAGARVILRVPPELASLMKTLDGVSQVFADDETLPDYDLHCPMMSLPLVFGTTLDTVPASIPYLRPDAERVARWRARLSGIGGLRVGLVWAGRSRVGYPELMATDQRRSMPLAALGPLAAVEGCSFISLQLGPPAEQTKSPPSGMILHDCTAEIADYMDTAALMENLDLVIGVDTSVAHLAGAMGKPIWMLNRYDTCWRWMLDRNDSPWYPTMRIFRQSEPGEWGPALATVAKALRDFVANRR